MSAETGADTLGIEGGNLYDKYGTTNPIERRLVGGFLGSVLELAARSGARDAHEIGCGEAELTIRLAAAGMAIRGSDVSADAIDEARVRVAASGESVPLEIKGVADLDPVADSAELIVCCEVMEHLADPDAALGALADLARPWLLASVPREPIWRALNLARGKYLSRAGNTPGHLNHWSKRAFLRFLGTRFDVVEVRTPLPWTMALCRVRAR
jgi:SAM-dependent methyltransferase